MPSWILAIDFGTSYTVAASKVGDRAPEVIEVGGERRMPSVVMIGTDGEVIVGRTADDLSGTHPESTLRAIKNRLGDQAPVVLDGRPHQVVNLVAALLKQVYAESVRQIGSDPSEVRLTHPATWNRPRLNRLLEAAAKAGLPNPALVPEPVAAALSFASEVGVAQGAHVVVYDLGGGTFDSAVVTASGGGFNIVGRPSGDQNIGGELFDEIIVNHLGEQLPPDAWEAIQIGEEPLWQQVGATLRNEARKAKETLSGNPYADLIVPLPSGLKQIRLTREEFEDLVRPYVSETVVLLDRCVQAAGLEADELSGISLVGGSSRSPIVERMVKEAFPSVPVIRRGDPKTAVASGAARAVRSSITPAPPVGGRTTQESAPGTAQQSVRLAPPVSEPPHGAGPDSSGPVPSGPASAPPHVAAPGSFAPAAPGGSVPPAPGGPTSAPPRPPGSVPPVPTPAGGRATQFAAAITAPPSGLTPVTPPKQKSKIPLVIGALVVLALVVGAIVFLAGRGDDNKADALPTRAAIKAALVPIRQVRSVLSADWNEEDIVGEGDPFCEQFGLAEPTRYNEILYSVADNTGGTDGGFTKTGFYESIAAFESESMATTSFDQDKAIADNCEVSQGNVDGVDVTYTITDAQRAATVLDRDVLAIRYEAAPTSDPGNVIIVGYVVETRIGHIVVGTNGYVYNAEATDTSIDQFFELTKAAFDRADEQL